jgi:TrmH family RNA methyltransferase
MITSLNNPTVKLIRSLRDRKARQESGLFYVEGIRLVGEAAQTGASIDTLIVSPELLTSSFALKLVEEQCTRGVALCEVSAQVFEKIALKEGPQGIAALARPRYLPLEEVCFDNRLCWVALDEVADPGNLGTILRTCDAVGCGGVILLDHSTDPYDPAAIRGSMGAIFSQTVVRTTFDDFIHWKKYQRINLVGTSDKAEEDYQAGVYSQPLVLLMGSERQGLPPQHLALCNHLVSIPMVGRSDSLNLAVATAVVLYEVFNQRRLCKG